ncbi:hypothetical protein [Blastomonas sp. SL216]|uniref:hypothetical protein n=1 Tax=Blastomonas sp. SL216 TaxID=2995169 RepID=UPI002376E2B6|nr:hypothetical protein OU999_08800 [Blastomonas sp. SL216]
MILLPALLIAALSPAAPCPDRTTNAAALCANREIAARWADVEAAFKAWDKVDPRKAVMAERHDEALADLRRGFEYNEEDSPQEGNADQIVESLGYVKSEIDGLTKIAASIRTPAGFGPDFARTCLATAVEMCVVEAAGVLNAGEEGRVRTVAWQKLSGLEPGGGIPLRMAIAWELTGDAPKLIGFTSTEGEAATPVLVDDGEKLVLQLPARTAGTGEGNADTLYLLRADGWANIGMNGWKYELRTRLPKGLGLWKGVEYSLYGISSSFSLWRDSDANCCPTAGDAFATFKIVNDRLAIDTLEINPAAAVQVKPLSCPILKATYRSPWPTRFTLHFEKPVLPPSAQSDMVAVLEQTDEDDKLIFRKYFSFAGSNGLGSTTLIPVDGMGDKENPPQMLPEQEGEEPLYFHAFIGEPNGLKYVAEPPMLDTPAPLGVFMPDLARSLWYDGIPAPKGGPPMRVDMPRDMWMGDCAE